MKQLSYKEKLELLEKVRNMLIEKEGEVPICICILELTGREARKLLPEIFMFRPSMERSGSAWWPMNKEHLPFRLNVVENTIDMLEKRIRLGEKVYSWEYKRYQVRRAIAYLKKEGNENKVLCQLLNRVPEMYYYKPLVKSSCWWKLEDRASRIEVLQTLNNQLTYCIDRQPLLKRLRNFLYLPIEIFNNE